MYAFILGVGQYHGLQSPRAQYSRPGHQEIFMTTRPGDLPPTKSLGIHRTGYPQSPIPGSFYWKKTFYMNIFLF